MPCHRMGEKSDAIDMDSWESNMSCAEINISNSTHARLHYTV